MSQIHLVGRDEEINMLEETILEKTGNEKLISISGIPGVGKSSFFKLFKQKHEQNPDSKFLCIEERIIAVDNPISLFNRFFSNLELKITPTKSKIKNFLTKYSKGIQLSSEILTQSCSIE
ncbi:MAG: hypothetical protein OEL84_03760 [Nitrosopumilus sp.]|nr:hypothetical protein [Nitrosopumilus sp.]